MAEGQRVLVIGEMQAGRLLPSTAEMLAAARTLQPPDGLEVSVGLLGSMPDSAASEAVQAGAERVYTVQHDLLAAVQPDLYLAALYAICQAATPHIILFARTPLGNELAPRLACRLGVSMLPDCLEIALDPQSGRLTGLRPVYGGNVLARVSCTAMPQIATLRLKVYTPLPPDAQRQGDIVAVPVHLEATMARSTVVREQVASSDGVRLEDARVVVAGGRGLGGPAPFRELQELAGLLGAGVGASRAAVDAGWVPGNWQIGLTGRTITPELYITVGISGASQHMAGCANAKCIVAINTDRDAHIFRAARYGVVGDWQTVLPEFMRALRELPG
jgi:electron transfer flavoprotein alpha subunit